MRSLLVAILLAAACGIAAEVATSGADATSGAASTAHAASSPPGLHFVSPGTVRREALKDVRRRLRRAEVPPGARRLKAAPRGSHLSGPGLAVDSKNFLDRGRVWALPQSPAVALAWIEAHPPAPLAITSGGEYGGGKNVIKEVGFEWKPLPNRVDSRVLYFAVGEAPDGRTILRVDSQAVWVLPHSPSEVIPPASTLEIVREPEAGGKATRQVVTDRKAIGRLAHHIDRLLPLQPVGFEECGPGLPEGLTKVTLTFWAADDVAVAEVAQDVPEGWCSYMEVTIEGEREPLLIGGGAMLEEQLPRLKPHA